MNVNLARFTKQSFDRRTSFVHVTSENSQKTGIYFFVKKLQLDFLQTDLAHMPTKRQRLLGHRRLQRHVQKALLDAERCMTVLKIVRLVCMWEWQARKSLKFKFLSTSWFGLFLKLPWLYAHAVLAPLGTAGFFIDKRKSRVNRGEMSDKTNGSSLSAHVSRAHV